jgi:hypothetical protein
MSHVTQLHDRGYLADYRQIMHRCSLPGNVQDEVYRQAHARVWRRSNGPWSRPYTHGGELCIISFYRIYKEYVGTVLVGVSSIEMMQDCPLHVLDEELRAYGGHSRYERDSQPRCPEETRSSAYERL